MSCQCTGKTGICKCACVKELEVKLTVAEETIVSLRDEIQRLYDEKAGASL